MGPVDLIIIGVIAAILGFAAWFIWQAKKKGAKCIGCPDGESCASQNCGGKCGGCNGKCGGAK